MTSATSLEPLEPLLPILNAFIHRHKNQHSASHWFRYVPILRRSLRSLLDLSTKLQLSSSTFKAIAAKEVRLKKHAIWLRAKLLPRCFLTFSQLAADNQHAPIGLLLIALLARVHSTLEAILPPPPVVATSPSLNSTASKAIDSTSRAANLPSTALSAAKDTFDRGTVISRTRFPSAPNLVKHSSKTITPASTPPPSRASPPEEMCLQAKDLKQYDSKQMKLVEQRRLVRGGEGDQPPPKRGKDKEKDATKSSKLKMTTKKKKTKAGDVFSSMFGGL